MIYPITVYGDPVLRKVTTDIAPDFAELDKLVGDMFETMHNAEGIGLAAPQIGLTSRIFVVDLSPLGEDEPLLKDFRKAFINPYIIQKEGEKVLMDEGCLSIPGMREDVLRFDTIRIKYFDQNWVEYDEVYSGFTSRVLQHEYDHLEGIMFVDYCSPFKKRIIKGKLADISKGQVTTSYRIKVPRT
ncbi:MAG: peptide deformylase [Mariniphaga sp.]